jgi:hypothetical protein
MLQEERPRTGFPAGAFLRSELSPESFRGYPALTTLAACGPLGPCVISKSTRSPS